MTHRAYRRISVRTHREIASRDPAPLFWLALAIGLLLIAGVLWLA